MSPPSSSKRRSESETSTAAEAPDLRGVVVIENHGYADVWLPATRNYKKPLRLIPGFNNVPKKYLHELTSKRIKNVDEEDEPESWRYPGKEALEQLQRPVRITQLGEGDTFGPRITIYEVDQLGPRGVEADESGVKVEGPPPPISLAAAGYNPETARRIISICRDVKRLEAWSTERSLSKEIADECLKRIAHLGG